MHRVTAVAVALLATGHPRPVPVFNIPSGTPAQQDAISSHIGALIAATPPGALIRVAIYHFTSPEFAQALIAADRRGVRVRLVVDASTLGGPAYRRVAAALGTVRGRRSWIVACHGGCVGDGIMHDKFFLFSRTGRARDVVVQSSANMTATDRVRAWNNAVTLHDPRLYRAYGAYFSALAAGHQHAGRDTADRHDAGRQGPGHDGAGRQGAGRDGAGRHGAGRPHVVRSGRVTLYTFPRTRPGDTLAELLRHVGCAGGTPVHVVMFRFTRVAVARRLRSLARHGCDVRVVYTHLGDRARALLAGTRLLRGRYRYDRAVEAYVHSKYVTVGGPPMVITGSPNITVPGLRHNDEAMLTIEDAVVRRAYEDDFARLWRTASRR